MKKYQVLLFDVDGTLLDFDKAERIGIERVLTHFGVPATEENVQKYHHLNADKHSPASSAWSTKRWVSGMLMSVGVESSH